MSRHLSRARGFTLVEVLMAIAVLGILTSLAVPSYQRYIYRAEAAELVLKMDRLRGALAELEAATGKRIGSEVYVWIKSDVVSPSATGAPSPTASRTLVWCEMPVGGRGACMHERPVSGISAADLTSAPYGIQLVPAAGMSPSGRVAGAFSVACLFPAHDLRGKQVAHAFIDLMRPYADRVVEGSRGAVLAFRLTASSKP